MASAGRVGEGALDDPPALLAGFVSRGDATAAASAALPLHKIASQAASRRLSPCRSRPRACRLLWLSFSLGWRALALPDEGRYVGVAWEMLRSGNWLIPTENGLPFFHKPPLFYWLTAASMQLFGTGAAAARLAPLLGGRAGRTWPAPADPSLGRRSRRPLDDARPADAALLLRRRPVRQPRHAGRRPASRWPSCWPRTPACSSAAASLTGARCSAPGLPPPSACWPRD